MKTKAFTLVEILCVVVILAVLSAILFPVFVNAKASAKGGAAQQNLRGFWLGLKIYQSENDEKTEYGLSEDMGLPPSDNGWLRFVDTYTGDYHYGWDHKKQYLPCGSSVEEQDYDGLGYMPLNHIEWKRSVEALEGNTVVMFDKNCNVTGTRISCQFCRKRSIGVTLDGSIKDRVSSDWQVDQQKFYK